MLAARTKNVLETEKDKKDKTDNPNPITYHPRPMADITKEVLDLARTGKGQEKEFRHYFHLTTLLQGLSNPIALLESAVDPETGDTAVHVAAASGHVGVLKTIQGVFVMRCGGTWPVQRGRAPELELELEEQPPYGRAASRKNGAGNTPLHCAAGGGWLDAARAVYAIFCSSYIPVHGGGTSSSRAGRKRGEDVGGR